MKPFLLLACMLFLFSCSGQRVKQWEEDVDYWVAEVKKQHYVYRSKPLPASFEDRVTRVKSMISSSSDQRMLVEMLGLSAFLGDGHTYVLPFAARAVETKALPVRLYLFSDGLFIIDAQAGFESLIGQKVTMFGSATSVDLMKKVAPYVSRDNDEGVIWIGPFLLQFQGMLEALDVAMADGKVTLSFGDGSTQAVPLTIFQPTRGVPKLIPSRKSQVVPLYLWQVGTAYWMTYLKKDKALYFQFNQVWEDGNETLRSFSAHLHDSLAIYKPNKLIIDVRHNNGGNAELLHPLMDVLASYRAVAGSEMVIITGRNTFSAAQIFISRADKDLHPKFAGERSSSKPNFVGEENSVVLPHSGGICSISNRYHESIPGDNRNWIEPDLSIPLSSTDYFAGKDPVLQAILAGK